MSMITDIDVLVFPRCTRHLINNIEVVDDLGLENYGHYLNGVMYISTLGIERLGVLKLVAHELAHKYCEQQRLKGDNRFLREFSLGHSEYIYYMARHRFGCNWVKARSIGENFAYAFSVYVADNSSSLRFNHSYFSNWFQL